MTASELIKRARSLADVPNSKFIDNDDEINSLWESWKDVYSKITDSSDDYFITEIIINTSTPGVATQLGETEWEVTIPSDVYKIRFVSYQDTGRWTSMDKFSTANRNKQASRPMYRWRGNKLWVIGSLYMGLPGQIRLEYYQPPIKPSVPKPSTFYGLSYPVYQRQSITSPQTFSIPEVSTGEDIDYFAYVYSTTQVRLESSTLNTLATLYTGATAITNLQYYQGYFYFLRAADIWRATTDYASTLVPVNITNTADVVNFNVYNNKLYYSNATDTYQANLDGTSPSVLYAYQTKDVYSNYYIKLSDGLIYDNTTSLAVLATRLAYDGEYLYYLDSAEVVNKLNPTTLTSTVVYTNVSEMGQVYEEFIAIKTTGWDLEAISTLDDTDFVYPTNEANEIMAYQSAIDYKRKQNGDISMLSARLNEVWMRFIEVLQRDEYQPERRATDVPFFGY